MPREGVFIISSNILHKDPIRFSFCFVWEQESIFETVRDFSKFHFFYTFMFYLGGGGYFLFKKMIFRSVSKRLSSESIRFICLLMVEVFKDARIRQIVWTMIALKQINKWASNRYEHARQRGKGSPMAVAETREQSI